MSDTNEANNTTPQPGVSSEEPTNPEATNPVVTTEGLVAEEPVNAAKVVWDKFPNATRQQLVKAASEFWGLVSSNAGGAEFQEQLREMNLKREMDLDDIERYKDDPVRLKYVQERLESLEAAIQRTMESSTAPASVTEAMVQLFVDILPLALNEASVNGADVLFRPGMNLGLVTGKGHIVVTQAPTTVRRNNATGVESDEPRQRNAERRTTQCDLILVYEQNNAQPIKEIKRVEGSGLSPLVRATVFLSQRAGRPHGCTMSGNDIVKLPPASKLKDLPWVPGLKGVTAAQTKFVAELATVTNLIVEGYNSDTLEYRMIPVGNSLRIEDVDGKPYRTKALREYKKLKLVE